MQTGKCLICGRETRSKKGEPQAPLYCEEHRAYAELDNKAIEDIPRELLAELLRAIFIRAREDYIYDTDGKRYDAWLFFHSKWAQWLSIEGFDPEKVVAIMDEEIRDGHIKDRIDSCK